MHWGGLWGIPGSDDTLRGVAVRLAWGKGECSEEAVSGYPDGFGSQEEKGRQEVLLLCLPVEGSWACGSSKAWCHQPLQIPCGEMCSQVGCGA